MRSLSLSSQALCPGALPGGTDGWHLREKAFRKGKKTPDRQKGREKSQETALRADRSENEEEDEDCLRPAAGISLPPSGRARSCGEHQSGAVMA